MSVAAVLMGIALLLAVVVGVVGRRLPERHTAIRAVDIAAPLERVAERIRDVERQPTWRRGVQRITVTSHSDGVLRYTERGGDGEIPFVFREEVPSHAFTATIDASTLPFGGAWTITLAPVTAGTRVTIREDGIVRSTLYRVVSAYIMGHTRTIDAYLADLAGSLASDQHGAPSLAPTSR